MSTKSGLNKLSGKGVFVRVDDSEVIVSSKGMFFQVDLFQRKGVPFAEVAKGKFVRLLKGGATSSPQYKWDEVHGIDLDESKPELKV